LLPSYRLNLGFDPVRIKPTNLIVDHVPRAVKEKKGRHTPNAVAGSQLAADPAGSAQPEHRRLPAEVTLEPVNDRLGQQAGASGI